MKIALNNKRLPNIEIDVPEYINNVDIFLLGIKDGYTNNIDVYSEDDDYLSGLMCGKDLKYRERVMHQIEIKEGEENSLYIILPEELVNQLNIKSEDTVEWVQLNEDTFILRKYKKDDV